MIQDRLHDLKLRPDRRLRAMQQRARERRVFESCGFADGLDDVLVARPWGVLREVGGPGGEVGVGEAEEDGGVALWSARRVEDRGMEKLSVGEAAPRRVSGESDV